MAAADKLPIVEKTSLFGTAVHAVLRSHSDAAREELAQGLRAAGIPIESMAPVVPSLDDVFLDVVDRA
jgi:hypothetical protein